MMQPEKEFEVFWEKERLEWPTSMAENPMLKDAVYAGWKAGKSQQTPIDVTPEVSDRDFADLVNSLRDTATEYAGTQQLRARIVTTLRDMKFYRGLLASALKLPFDDTTEPLAALDEAENITVESIKRMRAAHVPCADLTRRAEDLLQTIQRIKSCKSS